MAVGGFLGAFLLFKPMILMASILAFSFLVVGILPLWLPSMTRLGWAVSLLGFLLWAIAFVTRLLQLDRDKKPMPFYLYIALTLFLYSILVSVAQWHSASEIITAVKRYYQAWGVMFALAWLSIKQVDIKHLQKFILFVALVQLPFALYELIKLVPLRETFVASDPGLVPIDIVVGTFEGNLHGGGGNAEMATFQVFVFAFLLSKWREKLITTYQVLLLSCVVLAPVFLGETKIVLILLPLVFLGLYGAEIFTNPMRGVAAILTGLLITLLIGYVYAEFIIGDSLENIIEDTLRYNVQNIGYGDSLLNRTSVLTHWWENNSSDFVHLSLGHGLGSAQSKGLAYGHIAKNYVGYGINLTTASQMLWETGIIGLALLITMIVSAWQRCCLLIKQTSEPAYQADLVAIRAIIPAFIVYLFYRNSLNQVLQFELIFSLVLGYLAVLSYFINPSLNHLSHKSKGSQK